MSLWLSTIPVRSMVRKSFRYVIRQRRGLYRWSFWKVYMTDLVSSVVTPNQQLVGFKKVDIPWVAVLSSVILLMSIHLKGRWFGDGDNSGSFFSISRMDSPKQLGGGVWNIQHQGWNQRPNFRSDQPDGQLMYLTLYDSLCIHLLVSFSNHCRAEASRLRAKCWTELRLPGTTMMSDRCTSRMVLDGMHVG